MGPPQFAFDPADGAGFERIGGPRPGFGVAAFCTFERTLLKTFRPIRKSSRDHPGLAIGATRTICWQKFWSRLFRA